MALLKERRKKKKEKIIFDPVFCAGTEFQAGKSQCSNRVMFRMRGCSLVIPRFYGYRQQ